MQVVHNPAETKVVEVKPATYDLIGLSLEQVAVLTLLTGNAGGSAGSLGLYGKVHKVFDKEGYLKAFNDKDVIRINTQDIAALVALVK